MPSVNLNRAQESIRGSAPSLLRVFRPLESNWTDWKEEGGWRAVEWRCECGALRRHIPHNTFQPHSWLMAESMVETETNKSRERSKWNGNGQDRFPRRRDHVGDNGVAILPLGWIRGFFLSLFLSLSLHVSRRLQQQQQQQQQRPMVNR